MWRRGYSVEPIMLGDYYITIDVRHVYFVRLEATGVEFGFEHAPNPFQRRHVTQTFQQKQRIVQTNTNC
jgi:nitric oxide reductase activation protein